MEHAPNFLTCPSVPQLPPPHEGDSSDINTDEVKVHGHFQNPWDSPEFTKGKEQTEEKPLQPSPDPKSQTPYIPLRPDDNIHEETPNLKAEQQAPAALDSKTKKIGVRTYVKIAAVIFIAILFVPPLWALGRAGFAGLSAKRSLDNMEVLIEKGDIESAKSAAGQAQDDFLLMDKHLEGIGFWRDMPYVGTQLRGLQDTAQVSAQTLDGVRDILDVAIALQEALLLAAKTSSGQSVDLEAGISLKDLSPDERRALLASLYRSLPEIRLARDKIDIALAMWNDLPKENLAPPIKKALEPMAELLPLMQSSLEQGVPLIEVFVPLLGYPEAQSYLIATQNADEIRPGGGFIGSVLTVEIDGGYFDDYEFFDVYAIDNPASGVWNEKPPAPIQQHLGVTKWFMRDANWSPDFPTSAERVLDFYEREREIATGKKPQKTGFIALEPGFFESLLAFTGPVVVNGKTFDAANFMDVLQFEVEMAPGITQENRKDLMGEVADSIVAKIQSLPRSEWPKLLNIVTTALNQKQILIYNRDPELQALVDKRGWSARAKPTEGDFLWIIDANLAALKTDGVMNKSIQYTLDARDIENPKANVTLTYQNTNRTITWRYTRYRSYTRVYMPEGSELISSSGAMAGDLTQTGGRFTPGKVEVTKELGKTVFGAFWAIEPGRTGKLSFDYKLPRSSVESILDGTYRLDWPKQPGVDNAEFNVKILFPQSVVSASPPEPESKWGDNIYEAQASSLYDQIFQVKLK